MARESGVTVPGSLFWRVHGIGEWKLFLPWGVLDEACVCGLAAWRCEEQLGGSEEGRLCVCSVCQMMSAGLGPSLDSYAVLCEQPQTSSDECLAQLLNQNLPTWKCFPLICSSAVAETNSSVPLLSPQ